MIKQPLVALVTGGNRGMGFETCRELGQRGYKVLLAARDWRAGEEAAERLRGKGFAVEAHLLDVTRADHIHAFLSHIHRTNGCVDVLVNNAGIYLERNGPKVSDRVSVFDARLEVVRAILEANTLGPFVLSQEIIKSMRARNYGRVVNISSGMGQFSDMWGGAPGYRLSHVCINALTKIFAHELQGTNVLINSVDPGWVRTLSPDAARSIEQGVETTVWLATLPDGGPSGGFFRDKQPIPW
jgi:NAD(P)-dependent dehydrogenase (short-subunit alcohol dehydrogenase family)